MYRPEGWERRENNINKYDDDTCTWNDGYEAGADAMLKELRDGGERVDIAEYGGGNCYFPLLLKMPARGVVVFIPEEEK